MFILNEQIMNKMFIKDSNLFKLIRSFKVMALRETLMEVLREQRSMIMDKEQGIRRHAMIRVSEVMGFPHVIVISGMRRCGKSTLLRQIIDVHGADGSFYYVNFEDERLRDFKAEDFNQLYEAQLSLFGKKRLFLIDEIQNIEGFELFVRRFHEMGFKFVITGSNATLLSRELGTKLTGRHLKIDLRPFSFGEYLDFMNIEYDEASIQRTESRILIKKGFDDYLERGGMPEYLRFSDYEILQRIYEDIVIRDIVVRFNLDDLRMVKDTYSFLISNLTNRFTFNSVRKNLSMGSTNTVLNYIGYLEEANFCRIVYKFDRKIKKQAISGKKFYLTDHSFMRVVSTRLTRDRGKVLENIILSHLVGSGEIFYFDEGSECDFIVIRNNEIIGLFQVTWELNDGTKKRELDGLMKAMDEFGLKNGTIITYDQEDEIQYDSKVIRVIPAWKWCITQ